MLVPDRQADRKAAVYAQLMKKTENPSRDSSDADSMPVTVASDEPADIDNKEPPVKQMNMVTVEEKVFRSTYIDGKLVHQENTQRAFLKPVDASLLYPERFRVNTAFRRHIYHHFCCI